MDTGWSLSSSGRIHARSSIRPHDLDRYWCRPSHPYLLRRLHGARRGLLSVLRVSEPIRLLHAHAGFGEQLSFDVRWVGRRGSLLISPHWILVHAKIRGGCRKESIHRKPYWRLRIPACDHAHLLDIRSDRLRGCIRAPARYDVVQP